MAIVAPSRRLTMAQGLLRLLAFRDVAGDVHGADHLPLRIEDGSGADQKVAAQVVLADLGRVLIAVKGPRTQIADPGSDSYFWLLTSGFFPKFPGPGVRLR